MKLNRGIFFATAAVLVVGSVAAAGYAKSAGDDDQNAGAEQAMAEQTESSTQDALSGTAQNPGTEQYHGGSRGTAHAGSSHGVSFGRGARGGFGGARGGYGRGWGGGWGHGGWGRGGWEHGHWGRWGGGRWVGGRYVAGPYWGWCDDRYYVCERTWW